MCSIVSVIPEQFGSQLAGRGGCTNQLVVPNYRSGIYINASNSCFLVVDGWFLNWKNGDVGESDSVGESHEVH